MIVQSVLISVSRGVGALLLGGVILWQVVERCGPSTGSAIIHVSTPRVEVAVDDATYTVESLWASPLVCELRPGRHRIRMLRKGRVRYEEEFSLAPGEEKVLVAWDGYTDGRSPVEADRADEATGSRSRRRADEADSWRRSTAGRR